MRPGDLGRHRRGQERRLGSGRQAFDHGRCQSARGGSRDAAGLTRGIGMGRRIMAAHASAAGREGVARRRSLCRRLRTRLLSARRGRSAAAHAAASRSASGPPLRAMSCAWRSPSRPKSRPRSRCWKRRCWQPASLACRWDARSRAHLAAAHAWLGREPALAAERYAAILREWPHDVLALRLAQSCYFFLGQTAALRDVVDLVWHSWREEMPGFQYVLAMAAFACAENGDAEPCTRAGPASARDRAGFPGCNPRCRARALRVRASMRAARSGCASNVRTGRVNSRMSGHNAWHLAMFEHESGNATRALEHIGSPPVAAIADCDRRCG